MREMADIASRFWSKVDATGGIDACWPWTGVRIPSGYGQLWSGKRHRPATRIAVLLSGRDIPAGMIVCHTCDNPPCVNPDHLFVGTYSDNMRDMLAKGRGRWSRVR
jgi:hypothetical protein